MHNRPRSNGGILSGVKPLATEISLISYRVATLLEVVYADLDTLAGKLLLVPVRHCHVAPIYNRDHKDR